jgi:hypothetical protein
VVLFGIGVLLIVIGTKNIWKQRKNHADSLFTLLGRSVVLSVRRIGQASGSTCLAI